MRSIWVGAAVVRVDWGSVEATVASQFRGLANANDFVRVNFAGIEPRLCDYPPHKNS